MPTMSKIPPNVKPNMYRLFLKYLLKAYYDKLKDPGSVAAFRLPIIPDLKWDDILTWDMQKEIALPMLMNGQEVTRIRIIMTVNDPYSQDKDKPIVLDWIESDQDNIRILDDVFYQMQPTSLPSSFNSYDPGDSADIFGPEGGDSVKHNMGPKTMPTRPNPLARVHNITLMQNIAPVVKSKQIDWDKPSVAAMYMCDCSAGLFCEKIIQKFIDMRTPSEFAILLNTKINVEMAIPLFGCVLHRAHFSYSIVESNWSNGRTARAGVSAMDYLAPLATTFLEWEENEEAPNVLHKAFEILRTRVAGSNDPTHAQRSKELQEFINGEGPIICRRAAPVGGSGGHAGRIEHNFGTNKHLLAWHREAVDDLFYERTLAELHCILTYGECYWCYKNNELAFVMPQL